MIERTKVTAKKMRDVEWKCVYSYIGVNTSFKTYASDAIPGLTITYDKVGSKRSKTTYTISGVTSHPDLAAKSKWSAKTESPSQAVKIYNAQIEKAAGRRPSAGDPEQAGPAQ